jgi:hypothetical protein
MVFYDCRQFERAGILCGHALKVLDMMNIKLLSHHYVLKRSTQEARSGTLQDTKGKTVVVPRAQAGDENGLGPWSASRPRGGERRRHSSGAQDRR